MIQTQETVVKNHGSLTDNTSDQIFYGHGKLLLSGEYFVLDGAKALALPTRFGQSLQVRYSKSFDPKLYWKSYDYNGNLWLEATFEFWHFDILDEDPRLEVILLQKILREARKQNSHFLRDNLNVHVETKLGFPLDWGLGSSSTLIYNIAQWAYISPFELLFNTYGGSGYDIACAQSDGPIIYERKNDGQHWAPIIFNPTFSDKLYFVYLGKKMDSRKAISNYDQKRPHPPEVVIALSSLTDEIIKCSSFEEFEFLISAHEDLISKNLGLEKARKNFPEFWGEVKSLGAWGGDFVLVTSNRTVAETRNYFARLGYSIFIPYDEMILGRKETTRGACDYIQ